MSAYTKRELPRKSTDRFRPVEQLFNSNVHLVIVSANGAGRFAAHDHAGRLLVESSTQPLLDSCRFLIAEGVDPNAHCIMRHQGSDVDALRCKVGIGAKLTVAEGERDSPRFRRWRPMPSREGSPPIAKKPRPLAGVAAGVAL